MFKVTLLDKMKFLISINGKTVSDKIVICKAIFYYLLNEMYVPSCDLTISINGCKYFCRKNTKDLFLVLFHEEQFKHLFNVKNGIFIDIGAHIGKHTIYSAINGAKQVIAIEAAYSTFSILDYNVKLNNLHNVRIIHAACWDKAEQLKLYFDSDGIGSVMTQKSDTLESVDTVTIDSLTTSLNRVDVIKIDVEGAETNVLKGSRNTLNKFHPKIVFEAFTDEQYDNVMDVIESFGYNAIKISSCDYLAI